MTYLPASFIFTRSCDSKVLVLYFVIDCMFITLFFNFRSRYLKYSTEKYLCNKDNNQQHSASLEKNYFTLVLCKMFLKFWDQQFFRTTLVECIHFYFTTETVTRSQMLVSVKIFLRLWMKIIVFKAFCSKIHFILMITLYFLIMLFSICDHLNHYEALTSLLMLMTFLLMTSLLVYHIDIYANDATLYS